jgi:hypothetical protein
VLSLSLFRCGLRGIYKPGSCRIRVGLPSTSHVPPYYLPHALTMPLHPHDAQRARRFDESYRSARDQCISHAETSLYFYILGGTPRRVPTGAHGDEALL